MIPSSRRTGGRRLHGLVVAFVLAVLVTVAVSVEANAASKVTTLHFSVQQGSSDAVFQALVANFQKANPDIEIKIDYYPLVSYQQTLLSQLQAGNAADIIFGNGGTGQLYGFLELAKANRLADLSGSPWVKRIPPTGKPLYTVGNKVYGLPLGYVLVGLIYDKNAFAALKLKVPQTFSQLLDVCKTARANGKAAFSIAGTAFPNVGIWLQMIAASSVYSKDSSWNQKRIAGKTTFQGSDWRAAMTRFKTMIDNGCFQDGAAGGSIQANWSNVASGKTLGMGGPASVIPSILSVDANLQLGIFPFPGATAAETRATVGLADGLAVNAASQHKAEAKKFLDFVAREGQSRIWPNILRGISLSDANTGKVPKEAVLFKPFLQAKKTVSLPNLQWSNGNVYVQMGTNAQGLLTGQKSVDDVLKAMDDTWNNG